MENLAEKYLAESNQTTADFYGNCGELVDEMMHWMGEDKIRIFYISITSAILPLKPNGDYTDGGTYLWRYHMVPVIDGIVHCAWMPELMVSPDEYVKIGFPEQEVESSFPAEES